MLYTPYVPPDIVGFVVLIVAVLSPIFVTAVLLLLYIPYIPPLIVPVAIVNVPLLVIVVTVLVISPFPCIFTVHPLSIVMLSDFLLIVYPCNFIVIFLFIWTLEISVTSRSTVIVSPSLAWFKALSRV